MKNPFHHLQTLVCCACIELYGNTLGWNLGIGLWSCLSGCLWSEDTLGSWSINCTNSVSSGVQCHGGNIGFKETLRTVGLGVGLTDEVDLDLEAKGQGELSWQYILFQCLWLFLIRVATGRISVANLSLALRMLCVTTGTSIHICLISAGHGGVCLQPRCWGFIEAEGSWVPG